MTTMQLKKCTLCPLAMYALLVGEGPAQWVAFYCEYCDRGLR